MRNKNVFKTKVTITILSEGPLAIDGGDNDPFNLSAINYAITEGDCLGQTHEGISKRIDPKKVRSECLKLGNDGTFFDELD